MTPHSDNAFRPRTRDGLIFRPVASDWVVYDPVAEEMHVLNVTSALIWEMCDGTTDPGAMAAAIVDLLEDAPAPGEVERQVREALDELGEKGLFA